MKLRQLIAIYLVVVGVAVLVQFIAFPLYAEVIDGAYDPNGDARSVWLVLDWFMAAGLLLALITTFQAKKADCNCENQVMFYATLLIAIAFVPNWFAAALDKLDNGTIWHLIDTTLPVLFAKEAHRLWHRT